MQIHPYLGGGKAGDPSLYIDIVDRKRGMLFDCGYNTFRHASLRKVTDLFVSHTHIDHFIGFDALVRLNLAEKKTIHVYGPPGIRQNVAGKLQGYHWNICQSLQLQIVVHEILPAHIQVTQLDSWHGFAIKQSKEQQATDILLDDGEFTVNYIRLNHKTPSFGYTFVEQDTFNIRKEAMESLALAPGPWVATLKAQADLPEAREHKLTIGETDYAVGWLMDTLLVRKKGIKITYLTDFICDDATLTAIRDFAWETDILFCEAAFLEQDRAKAKATYHLTAKEAGIIARTAQVKQLVLFHFSRRYQDYAALIAEARAEFPVVE